MATLVQTLLSRVNSLTVVIDSIISKAKKISSLPSATVPLDGADLFMVEQGGISKKVASSDVGGASSGGKILFGSWQIFGHSGDGAPTLVAGNIIQGWFSTTEFWHAARYNGGDVALRGSYTIINSTEGL